MKNLFAFIAIILSYGVTAQTYLKPVVIGAVDLGGCNNEVVLETYNLPADATFDYGNIQTNPGVSINAGDTVNGVCMTDPYANNSSNEQFRMSITNGYITNYGVLYSSCILPHFNYNVINYVEPTGGFYDPLSSDGELTLEFDSSIVLGGGYSIYAFQEQGDINNITFPTANSVTFHDLSHGWMTLFMPNLTDTTDHLETRFYFGDPNEIYINTGLDMALSMQHADNNCVGWVNATPTNATGNVLSIWDNQVYNTHTQFNLCPGLYSVYTYETDVQTAMYVAGSIDTFVVTNSNTAYIDSSIYLYAAQDTSYHNFQNCNFDFTAPIDTLTYSEDTVYQGGGITVITFEMNLYQDSTFITVTDSLTLLNDSLIHLDVTVWCDSTLGNKANSFNGRRIVFLRGVDEHSFSQGTASTSELADPIFGFYPNPASDGITIYHEHLNGAEIKIYGTNGELYHKSTLNSLEAFIDLVDFAPGMYFLEIFHASYQASMKLTKL